MKFEWHPVLVEGGCGLAAEPEDYDGHPAPSVLRLDYSPRFAAPTRLALAAVLAFRPYLSGALRFPKPISPEVADEMREILRPREIFPEPIDYDPRAIPTGPGVMRLHDSAATVSPGSPAGPLDLVLVEAASVFGHQLEANVMVVPTNASLLTPAVANPLFRLLPSLAVAVLLAEDFGVGSIQVHEEVARAEHFEQIAGAFASSGLSLTAGGSREADQAERRRSTAPFSTSSSS